MTTLAEESARIMIKFIFPKKFKLLGQLVIYHDIKAGGSEFDHCLHSTTNENFLFHFLCFTLYSTNPNSHVFFLSLKKKKKKTNI